MAQPDFNDETLMAFADGKLEEPQFSAVAAAVETDATLAARLEALVAGKDFARALYEPLLQRPVPAPLRKSVEAAIADASVQQSNVTPFPTSRASTKPARNWLPLAAAACVAVIVAGPIGFLIGTGGGSTQATHIAIGEPLSGELVALVATLPSGAERALSGGTTLHPIASFSDGAGTLCREFELHGTASLVAVACRPGDQWVTTFALQTAAPGGYLAASALAPLDAYFQAIEAGPPYSAEQEASVLSGD